MNFFSVDDFPNIWFRFHVAGTFPSHHFYIDQIYPLGGTRSKFSFSKCPEDFPSKPCGYLFLSVFVSKLRVFALSLYFLVEMGFFVVKKWKRKHFQMFFCLVPSFSRDCFMEILNLLEKQSIWYQCSLKILLIFLKLWFSKIFSPT